MAWPSSKWAALLWRRGGVGSLTPPARGPTAGAQTSWRHWLLYLLSSTLVIGSLVPVLGSSWPIFRPNPRKPETTTQTKMLCLPRPPNRRAPWLFGGLSRSLWSGGHSLSFPWSGSKAPFLGSCVTNSPYSFSLDPERIHNTQHAVPYLLYIYAGRPDLTIDISATEIISPITIIICTQDLPHLSLAFVI